MVARRQRGESNTRLVDEHAPIDIGIHRDAQVGLLGLHLLAEVSLK
jgi:hypothetical protein